MYHKSRVHIFIISEDVVFVRLMEYMFNKYLLNPIITKYYSIIELKENIDINPDLIILDDVVAGAASFEVISFLRLNRQFLNTICFFGENVYDMNINSLKRGANYFYNKPFNPVKVVNEIIINLKYFDL